MTNAGQVVGIAQGEIALKHATEREAFEYPCRPAGNSVYVADMATEISSTS